MHLDSRTDNGIYFISECEINHVQFLRVLRVLRGSTLAFCDNPRSVPVADPLDRAVEALVEQPGAADRALAEGLLGRRVDLLAVGEHQRAWAERAQDRRVGIALPG